MEKSLVPETFIGLDLLISPLSPTADKHSLRLQTDARASEHFTHVPHCCDTNNWYYLIDKSSCYQEFEIPGSNRPSTWYCELCELIAIMNKKKNRIILLFLTH